MGHIGTLDTTIVNATSTTGVLTAAAAVPAGRTLLIGCAWESGPGALPTITSCVDSRGNTYTTTPDAGINAGTTVAVAVLRGRVTTPLQAGDTITITISTSRTRWALQADEFDDINTSPLDKTATTTGTGVTNLTTGTTAATAQADELVYAVFGFGQGRTVTVPGGWTAGPKVETTAGSTDRALQVAHRYVTATGTQEGTLTISTASTYAAAIATYRATPAPAPATGGGWGYIPI